jgi:hypothetical protein
LVPAQNDLDLQAASPSGWNSYAAAFINNDVPLEDVGRELELELIPPKETVMNHTRWTALYCLILVFALSTACLTLFPESPGPTPMETEEWFEPNTDPLKFDPLSLPNAQVGVPYEVEIKVTGNVTPVGGVTVNPDTLPPGLELVFDEEGTDTARITGIPEEAGTYSFYIDVWCYGTQVSGQTGGKEYTIEVE